MMKKFKLLIIICILFIFVSLTTNILFTNKKTPCFFGKHIYIVNNPNPMEGEISTGAALLAKDAKGINIIKDDIVLCYPADSPNKLTLRKIDFITKNADGTQNFYTSDIFHKDIIGYISKDMIVAVCTSNLESIYLGKFISFTISIEGIICMMVLPSIILVILIISSINHSKPKINFEYDFDLYTDHKTKNTPLFHPNLNINQKLNRKKMSIAHNFSKKEVNQNFSYYKRQNCKIPFNTQKTSITKDTSFTQKNNMQSDSTQSASALREKMLSKKDVTEIEKISTVHPVTVTNKVPKKNNSVSNISVDDLLKMIEEEKKKL